MKQQQNTGANILNFNFSEKFLNVSFRMSVYG